MSATFKSFADARPGNRRGGFNSSKIVRGKTTPENEEGRNESVQATRKKLELFPPDTACGNKESYLRRYRVVSSRPSCVKNPKKFSNYVEYLHLGKISYFMLIKK